jgi:hypothetical protein
LKAEGFHAEAMDDIALFEEMIDICCRTSVLNSKAPSPKFELLHMRAKAKRFPDAQCDCDIETN